MKCYTGFEQGAYFGFLKSHFYFERPNKSLNYKYLYKFFHTNDDLTVAPVTKKKKTRPIEGITL